jgi:hypothetical protein
VNLQTATILFNTRAQVDQLWSLGHLPPFVILAAQIVDFILLKCLHQGGWDIYFDPEANACKLKELPK